MMLKLIVLLISLSFFQACQVSDSVVNAAKSVVGSNYSTTLDPEISEDGWYKLNDSLAVTLSSSNTIQVVGLPYIEADVGVKLGFSNDCSPASDCPASQVSGLSKVKFSPSRFVITGGFELATPNGNYYISFGTANGLDTICSQCSGTQMALQLASIINNSSHYAFEGLTAIAFENSVRLTAKRQFYYSSGSGTNEITFNYFVSSDDFDPYGIVIDENIKLNGGRISIINSLESKSAELALDIPRHSIRLDGDAPYFLEITPPVGKHYATGEQLTYRLKFSEEVTVFNTPTFDIHFPSETVQASYSSGSGTNNLAFAYTILSDDNVTTSFSTDSVLDFDEGSEIYITDEAGNISSTSITSLTSSNITINISQPSIAGMTLPANATYEEGDQLDFVVTMSEAVNVTGTPAIPLSLQSGTYYATYLSGSGTTTLTFRYTVGRNHVDTNGIEVLSPLELKGGTIKNLTGNQVASLIHQIDPSDSASILVDAATGPYVTSVTRPTNQFYIENEDISFNVQFNTPVTVTGNPTLPIKVGQSNLVATYVSSNGPGDILTFTYTPALNDEDLDGIILSGPINLNGGTLVDASNKAAILTYSPPSTSGIKVDGTIPTVVSVTPLASGTFQEDGRLSISVQFSETVTVASVSGGQSLPSLSLTIDGTQKSAPYVSGSGTNTLLFIYTIDDDLEDSDGISIDSLAINDSAIRDLRGHSANLAFAPVVTSNAIIDSRIPEADPVVLPANGIYKAGDVLEFEVSWSEPVVTTGRIKLQLTIGSKTAYAELDQAQSTSTLHKYTYTIANGDIDADGIGVTSQIYLSGGSIKDFSGNNADIDLTIGDLSNVTVDGIAPKVTSQTFPSIGIYRLGQNLNFELTWDEDVTVVGTPYLKLILGTTPVNATYVSTVGRTTLFRYTTQAGDVDTNGITLLTSIVTDSTNYIRDAAENRNSNLIKTSTALTNVKIDTISPSITSFILPADETYKTSESLQFKVYWSKPVTITGTPRIELTVGGDTRYAEYVPGTNPSTFSHFKWVVTDDSEDDDGIEIPVVSIDGDGNNLGTIDLNGGTITDTAANNASLTFIIGDTSDIYVDGIIVRVDSTNPVEPSPAIALGTTETFYYDDVISFKVNFTDDINVDTSGGTPYIELNIGEETKRAELATINNDNLVFSYTIEDGLEASEVTVVGGVHLNGAIIQDFELTPQNVDLSFDSQTFTNISIKATRPTILSATTTNSSASTRPGIFRDREVMTFRLVFSENVFVSGGTPELTLTIGPDVRTATYLSGSGTNTLNFRYEVGTSPTKNLLDLDGIEVADTINFNGAEIKDVDGNDMVNDVPYDEKDFVYYSSIRGHYRLEEGFYTTTSCHDEKQCVTRLTDMSGRGNDLTPKSGEVGPEVVEGGFGGNSTDYMQFDNDSSLVTTTHFTSLRQIIFAMKPPTDGSTTTTASTHTLLNRNASSTGTSLTPAIRYSASSTSHTILTAPQQKMITNSGSFGSYASSHTTNWDPDLEYIMGLQFITTSSGTIIPFYRGSIIGGDSFNGRIAEILAISGTPLSEDQMKEVIRQLNVIHDVY